MNVRTPVLLAAIVVLASCSQPVPLPNGPNEPVLNVDPARHGNLAAAQELSREAYDRLTAAQVANEFDLGGHAANAKELLRQANDEMKLAALAANRR